ncbi:MAG: MFS transporter, partial [Chloroflexi bacterium]|nr:MFS transporter [Chloroflexota bacterium]
MSTENESEPDPRLRNIIIFDSLSTVAWQMCMTSPLVLFMRSLGAPSLALGLLAGLNPLMAVLQLPMSRFVERVGHRRLMMFGWGMRTAVFAPMILMPFIADSIGKPLAVILVLVMIALFTMLRSMAVVAWLPWMSALIPATQRGEFLARDRFFMNITSLLGLALSGLLLAQGSPHDYAEVFLVGELAAVASLFYLNRIPSPQMPAEHATSPAPRPSVRAVLREPNFRKIVAFSALAQIINLGAGAFVTVYARTRIGLSDSTLLWLSASASLLVIFTMAWVRNRLDRTGSKPFLGITLAWWTISVLIWALLAASGASLGVIVAPVLLVVTECFAWLFELFNTRLTMNTLATSDNNATGFAAYSMIVNVTAGIAPIVFGALLDALHGFELPVGALRFDNYTALFGLE